MLLAWLVVSTGSWFNEHIQVTYVAASGNVPGLEMLLYLGKPVGGVRLSHVVQVAARLNIWFRVDSPPRWYCCMCCAPVARTLDKVVVLT